MPASSQGALRSRRFCRFALAQYLGTMRRCGVRCVPINDILWPTSSGCAAWRSHLKVVVDDICPETKGVGHTYQAAGLEYLSHLRESATRQRERQSRARALSLQMHRMFLPVAEEITCKRMESGKMLLDIAHLVDKKTVERYQNKYSTATLELKDCAMQLSGPWPPYHFVQREQRGHA